MRLHRIAPLAVALAMIATILGEAEARDGHHPLGGSADTETPPGSSSTLTSGDYSNDVRSADVFFESDTMNPNDYKIMVFTLMSLKAKTTKTSKKNRLVACAAMSADHMRYIQDRFLDTSVPPEQVEAIAGSRGAAYALLCMNLARMMAEIEAEGPPVRVSAARSECDVVPFKVKVRTERTDDGGYRMSPTGKVTDGTSALATRVTCSGRGTHLKVRVTPKKKVPLNKVAGKQFAIGVANPPSAESTADITIGFKGR